MDYIKIAEGFGLEGYAAKDTAEFENILRRSISAPGPKLIALAVEPEDKQLPPVPGWYRFAKSAGAENLYGSDCM